MANRTVKPLTLSEAERAAETLGLTLEDVTDETLRDAFRDRVRQVHPDATTVPFANAAHAIAEARAAKATLLMWLALKPSATCRACGGKGYVPTGLFSTKPCTSC